MDEQAQHEAALVAAAKVLGMKNTIHIWHIPDWVGDCNEQTDEADDYVMISFSASQNRLLSQRLEAPKGYREYEYTEKSIMEQFIYVGKEDLYDPDAYNPENFPWYKTDDPNVKQVLLVLPRLLESL